MAKAKKSEDFKSKTVDELHKALLDARKEQFNLRFQRSSNQLEKTSEIRKSRRNIARIKTFLTAKSEKKAAPVKTAKSAPAKKAKTATKSKKTAA
jgi:large subunit ribosomal protein L29